MPTATRRAQRFPVVVSALALAGFGALAGPRPAGADCTSACDDQYYACSNTNEIDWCSSYRSICYQRCTFADQYGAIAYSPSTGSYGYSYERESQRQAEGAALGYCRQNAGGSDCAVEIWFVNACAALATAPDGSRGSAWAESRAAAEAQALSDCALVAGGSCEILAWACSGS